MNAVQKDIILKLFDPVVRLSEKEIEPLVAENCSAFIFEYRDKMTRKSLISYMLRLPDYFSVYDIPVATFTGASMIVKWRHFSRNAMCIVKFNDENKIFYLYLDDTKQSPLEDLVMRVYIIALSLLIIYLLFINPK